MRHQNHRVRSKSGKNSCREGRALKRLLCRTVQQLCREDILTTHDSNKMGLVVSRKALEYTVDLTKPLIGRAYVRSLLVRAVTSLGDSLLAYDIFRSVAATFPKDQSRLFTAEKGGTPPDSKELERLIARLELRVASTVSSKPREEIYREFSLFGTNSNESIELYEH